jgi:hypothetical protein
MVVPAPFYPESGRLHESQIEYRDRKYCIRFLRRSAPIAHNLRIARDCRLGRHRLAVVILTRIQLVEAAARNWHA